jgi:cyclic pyranopterin phosphate synthase
MPQTYMIDKYGRKITNLRISVTQRCNLNCSYCHKEGESAGSLSEISLKTIQKLVKCAGEMGVKSVKITGGEPLLRRDICEIIKSIAHIPGIEDVALTTNGILLQEYAYSLKRAGLNRVNIGCDSISSSIVAKRVENILPGLISAKKVGLEPIKINMVVLKDINHHKIKEMIKFVGKYKVILQLIELIPTRNWYYQKHYFSLNTMEKELQKKAKKIEIREMQARKQYYLNNAIVEIVRPTHTLFCKYCTKIRVTSNGKIKPCLMRDDNLVEFKDKTSFIEALRRRSIFF